jgi:hypothetical protein
MAVVVHHDGGLLFLDTEFSVFADRHLVAEHVIEYTCSVLS